MLRTALLPISEPQAASAAGGVKVVTDANGAFNTTFDVLTYVFAGNTTNADLSILGDAISVLSVAARLLDSTRSPVFQRADVPLGGTAPLRISYSISDPVIPGTEFAIVPLVDSAASAEGVTASVYATELTPALCEALSLCSPEDTRLNLNEYRGRTLSDQSLNKTQAEMVKAAGLQVCSGYPVGTVDWGACRWALPKIGVFLITLCNDGGACFTSTRHVSAVYPVFFFVLVFSSQWMFF
jgi:hypothetical protein